MGVNTNFNHFTTIILFLFLFLALGFTAGTVDADQGRIALVANLEGNWDIFVYDLDTKRTDKITNTPYDEETPTWSPDGRFVVYAASDGLLHMANLESREQTSLIFKEWPGKFVNPSYSPDGKKIAAAYFKNKKVDDTDLVVINLEAKKVTPFLAQPSAQFFPAWSPDGRKIAYINVHCGLDCGHIIQELWLAKAAGHYARQLLLTDAMCMQPAWSPDGRKIAFSVNIKGNFDIWIYNLSNKELKQVTYNNNLDNNPSWSPDGKKLGFISTRSGWRAIWIKDLETKELYRLAPFKQKDVECKDIAWH